MGGTACERACRTARGRASVDRGAKTARTQLSDLCDDGTADSHFVGLIALLPVVAIFVGAVVVMIRFGSNR